MKTTQDIINEAAKKEAELGTKKTNRGEIRADYFVRGATFALSTPELWREHATGFTVWANERYTWVEGNKWDGDNDETYTTDELFDLYLEQLSKQLKNKVR